MQFGNVGIHTVTQW